MWYIAFLSHIDACPDTNMAHMAAREEACAVKKLKNSERGFEPRFAVRTSDRRRLVSTHTHIYAQEYFVTLYIT